jgi:hypothetical protein
LVLVTYQVLPVTLMPWLQQPLSYAIAACEARAWWTPLIAQDAGLGGRLLVHQPFMLPGVFNPEEIREGATP